MKSQSSCSGCKSTARLGLYSLVVLLLLGSVVPALAYDDYDEIGDPSEGVDMYDSDIPVTPMSLANFDLEGYDDLGNVHHDLGQRNDAEETSRMRFATANVTTSNSTNSTGNSTASNSTTVATPISIPADPPAPTPATVEELLNTWHHGVNYGPPRLLDEDLQLPGRCIVWGYPQSVITFDSVRYRFSGAGEFTLYRQPYIREEIHALQRRAGSASFNYGFGIRYGDDVASITLAKHSSKPGEMEVEVLVNNKTVNVNHRPVVGPFMFLQQNNFNSNKQILAIRTTSGTRLAVTVHRWNQLTHLNAFIQVAANNWNQGLCGSFDLDPSNDFHDASHHQVNSSVNFALAWGQNSHTSDIFPTYAPGGNGDLVSSTQPKLSALESSKKRRHKAYRICASYDASIKYDCAANVLIGGLNAIEEVAQIQIISNEGQILMDADAGKCVKSQFKLGDWGKFGDCTASCGQGTQNRTRSIFPAGSTKSCGILYQLRTCHRPCDHVGIWGKCIAFGAGHVVTFDRDMFDYEGTGEYLLYRHINHKEEIHITKYRPFPAAKFTYTSGAAFRHGGDVFSVQLLAPNYDRPVFRFNGMYVVPTLQTVVYGFFTVTQSGTFEEREKHYIVEVRIPGGTTLTINFQQFNDWNQLTVYAEVGGNKIGTTEGFCGNYDFDASNDRINLISGERDLNTSSLGWSYAMQYNQSLFTDKVPLGSLPLLERLTPADLGADALKLEDANAACGDIAHELRGSCLIDFLAAGIATVGGLREVEAILGDYKHSAPRTSLDCLRAAGTTLGPATPWSSTCSAKCGPGALTRTSTIYSADGKECGALTQSKFCEIQPCPQNCLMTAWSNWGECSAKCGDGTQTRNRTIIREPKFGGKACEHLLETKACKIQDCCKFTPWNQWGNCLNGLAARTRQLVSGGADCGPLREVKACCDVGPWSDWTPCVGGFKSRTRAVAGAASCGHKVERLPCCEIGAWSEWSACGDDGYQARVRDVIGDATCGEKSERRPCCRVGDWTEWEACVGGKQARRRLVTGHGTCSQLHPRLESRDCCSVGNWSSWSGCIDGVQQRHRTVEGSPSACGASKESRTCCDIGEWSPWSDCLADGTQTRSRHIVGAALCGEKTQKQTCCSVGAWSAWSACNSTGVKTRYRTVAGSERCHFEHPLNESQICCEVGQWGPWSTCQPGGRKTRSRPVTGHSTCIIDHPPVDSADCCEVGAWSAWTNCSSTGFKMRERTVVGDPKCFTVNPSTERKECCDVGAWSEWTNCTNGSQTRARTVVGNSECVSRNIPHELRGCCQTGPWSDWSICRDGKQSRNRTVEGTPAVAGVVCGPSSETRDCCSTSEWSEWSACNNEGFIVRNRKVFGSAACVSGTKAGFPNEERQPCCKVGDWGDWGACQPDGWQVRVRQVLGHSRCGSEVPRENKQACCYTSGWGEWTACAGGFRTRVRRVAGPAACTSANQALETEPCCEIKNWSGWSTCDPVAKVEVRTRVIIGNSTCIESNPSKETRPCNAPVPSQSQGADNTTGCYTCYPNEANETKIIVEAEEKGATVSSPPANKTDTTTTTTAKTSASIHDAVGDVLPRNTHSKHNHKHSSSSSSSMNFRELMPGLEPRNSHRHHRHQHMKLGAISLENSDDDDALNAFGIDEVSDSLEDESEI